MNGCHTSSGLSAETRGGRRAPKRPTAPQVSLRGGRSPSWLSALVIIVSRVRDRAYSVPRLHVLRSRAVGVGALRCHAIDLDRPIAVAFAEIAHLTGELALLDDVLPLRVVLVLHEIDDGVDVLVVNVP